MMQLLENVFITGLMGKDILSIGRCKYLKYLPEKDERKVNILLFR